MSTKGTAEGFSGSRGTVPRGCGDGSTRVRERLPPAAGTVPPGRGRSSVQVRQEFRTGSARSPPAPGSGSSRNVGFAPKSAAHAGVDMPPECPRGRSRRNPDSTPAEIGRNPAGTSRREQRCDSGDGGEEDSGAGEATAVRTAGARTGSGRCRGQRPGRHVPASRAGPPPAGIVAAEPPVARPAPASRLSKPRADPRHHASPAARNGTERMAGRTATYTGSTLRLAWPPRRAHRSPLNDPRTGPKTDRGPTEDRNRTGPEPTLLGRLGPFGGPSVRGSFLAIRHKPLNGRDAANYAGCTRFAHVRAARVPGACTAPAVKRRTRWLNRDPGEGDPRTPRHPRPAGLPPAASRGEPQ
ncbi:MAG: hypothetical protein QOF98_535 [Streptomyces sp.]|nr:hypothetical protein [Streptomyces sp.]